MDFVDVLLTHAPDTPVEVGIICIELSKNKILKTFTSLPAQDKIVEFVRVLYDIGHKEIADNICFRFAEEGFDCLRPLYEEYQL